MKYNRKYWLERYLNKEAILTWFENYKTFYYKLPSLEQIKREFLAGERNEINLIFTSEQDREKAYKFVEKVVSEI